MSNEDKTIQLLRNLIAEVRAEGGKVLTEGKVLAQSADDSKLLKEYITKNVMDALRGD